MVEQHFGKVQIQVQFLVGAPILNNTMDLVTVTCLRDWRDMQRQAQSINLYLEPCTHWVIVNDKYIDKSFWEELLTPYYSKHNLKLLFPKWYEFNYFQKNFYEPRHPPGYKNQQVHKLLISQEINDDYLVIDSDTFFVKQTSITEWKDVVGTGRTVPFSQVSNDLQQSIRAYAKIIGCDIPEMVFDNCIPIVIRNDVMKSFKNLPKLVKRFNRVKRLIQADIYFYNLLAYKAGMYDGKSKLTNDKSRLFYDRRFSKFEKPSALKAMLFKPEYFDEVERRKVNEFLLSIGITILYQ